MQTKIYAVGDVHGRLDLLEELYEQIRAHAARHPAQRQVLLHLGDYVDRGPDSRGVILRVKAELAGFETVALKGNHEQMMLDFLEEGSGDALEIWLRNGGAAALESFGIDTDLDSVDREEAIASVGPDILRWLSTLVRSHREGGFFFAHAGVRPGVPLNRQRPEDLIWIRERFTDSDEDFGLRIVHGHSPSEAPVVRRNRIGIDTGAVWTGRLTAAILDPDRPLDEPAFLMTAGPTLDELEDSQR